MLNVVLRIICLPLGQPDQVITCTCSYVGDNIEDVCFMNNIYKKDEIKESIKQKEQYDGNCCEIIKISKDYFIIFKNLVEFIKN